MDKVSFRRALWTIAPALAALAVYAGTLTAGFVYDDELLIRTNPWVQDAHRLPQLATKPLLVAVPGGTTNYYRPLVVAAYNLAWQTLGGRPLAFHALNVLFHMLNAMLVVQLVRRVTAASDVVAVGAGLLFAVHPLGTEAVAWASCLPELAYSAFGLSALAIHVLSWSREREPARRLRAAAWGLFTMACLCKETALAIVPLVLLLELWVRPGRPPEARARWREAGRGVAPYLVAAVLVLAARAAVLGGLVPPNVSGSPTLRDTVLNAPWLLVLYVKSMIVPWPLVVEHVVVLITSAADPRFVLGAALAVAGWVAILRLRRHRPDLAFAAALAIVPLLPALYLPALGRDPIAERYAYLGVAGICWLAIGGAAALSARGGTAAPRWALPMLVAVLVLAGGALTVARAADWRDDGSLGRATQRDEPRAAVGYVLTGTWQSKRGLRDDALRTFESGVSRVPDSAELRLNAIVLASQLGRISPADAIAAYGRLAAAAPRNALVHYNLGQALLQAGRRDEARSAFNRSLELAPASVPAMTALAVIASESGDDATSARLCRRALAIDARSTVALQQLGVALMRAGDSAGAIAALERAAALDPADAETLNRLGVAYVRAGRVDDARRAWERALSIDPGFTKARQNLERLSRGAR